MTTQALGQTHESQATAQSVPIEDGVGRLYTGTTAGMIGERAGRAACSAARRAARRTRSGASRSPRRWTSRSAPRGRATAACSALFDSPFVRPSVTQLELVAGGARPALRHRSAAGPARGGLHAFDCNTHRYWFCSTERPWDGAQAMCQRGRPRPGRDRQPARRTCELFDQIAPTAEHYLIGLRALRRTRAGAPRRVGAWVDGATLAATATSWPASPTRPRTPARACATRTAGAGSTCRRAGSAIATSASRPGAAPIRRRRATAPQVVDLFGATRRFVGSTDRARPTRRPRSATCTASCGAWRPRPTRCSASTSPTTDASASTSPARSPARSLGVFPAAIGTAGYAMPATSARGWPTPRQISRR